MPRIENLKKVMIFGSGPIVIGQACEFDYSGTQACKALMKEGLEVILVNSNPATIMTDPEIATRVYVEPLKVPFVSRILEQERPDAIIPTLGGQTALNLALDLDRSGILNELGISFLGADPATIRSAEDREAFCHILDSVGARYPKSQMVRTFEQGLEVAEILSYPLILRPNYTLGGGGGGIAYSLEEYKTKLVTALQESPTSEVLVEQSVAGWKEFELEVMRDRRGTFVVICSIENVDPCGVHTGDSITVAPQQTLTDCQYQEMRDEAKKIINAVGLTCGGANIQFVVDPVTGERLVIEMNPRVSRSSALASKATGFPIAKIAALLAVGYGLDEIQNDITGTTPSCYEPALDYVVTKIPRFNFEKFPEVNKLGVPNDLLSTQMKSIGEVMAIGRTFKESFMKALNSMEQKDLSYEGRSSLEERLSYPNSRRIHWIFEALQEGWTIERLNLLTQIDVWFLEQFADLVQIEENLTQLDRNSLLRAKRAGISDARIARKTSLSEEEVWKRRRELDLHPAFLKVDTCAGEFASETPYFYSTYWGDPKDYLRRSTSSERDRVVVLGSGPNRIGQGIEFDYGCVRGVKALQRRNWVVAMINSNPETVSTDYDTANELYFEPLTLECCREVFHHIGPKGFVAQLGGQTAINLAGGLVDSGYSMLGSSLETIDLAEDRARFAKICREFDFKIPPSGFAGDLTEALKVAQQIGYPLLCRPSYVLGGRRMEIIENQDELEGYFQRSSDEVSSDRPALMDFFLEGALEVDVDLVRGKDWVVVGGVVEHIEAAGVHSGDSMGVLPPQRLKDETCVKIEELSSQLADRMNIIGHLNLQLAIKDDQIFVLEANPRSSRSVPFVVKSTLIPLVDLAVDAMLGLDRIKVQPERYQWKEMTSVCVKGVVFPFNKFPGADIVLGPEMKSTGESMGRGKDYAEALLKALLSSQMTLPLKGEVFFSLRDKDKDALVEVAKELVTMGYALSATPGTAQFFGDHSLPCIIVRKVHQGRPNCVDRIRSGKVDFVINTTSGRLAQEASFSIRRSCIDYRVPCITESDAVLAFLVALKKHRSGEFEVSPLPARLMNH